MGSSLGKKIEDEMKRINNTEYKINMKPLQKISVGDIGYYHKHEWTKSNRYELALPQLTYEEQGPSLQSEWHFEDTCNFTTVGEVELHSLGITASTGSCYEFTSEQSALWRLAGMNTRVLDTASKNTVKKLWEKQEPAMMEELGDDEMASKLYIVTGVVEGKGPGVILFKHSKKHGGKIYITAAVPTTVTTGTVVGGFLYTNLSAVDVAHTVGDDQTVTVFLILQPLQRHRGSTEDQDWPRELVGLPVVSENPRD